MKTRNSQQLVRVLAALCVASSSACWAGAEWQDAAAPAAPQSLACGAAMIPLLRAVDDLRREQAVLERGTDTLALRVVQARLAAASALQLYTLRRYAGSDTAGAVSAMREALAMAEALPRERGATLVASARASLGEMVGPAESAMDARPHGGRQ